MKSKENFSRDFCERICPILEIPLPKHVEQKQIYNKVMMASILIRELKTITIYAKPIFFQN